MIQSNNDKRPTSATGNRYNTNVSDLYLIISMHVGVYVDMGIEQAAVYYTCLFPWERTFLNAHQ